MGHSPLRFIEKPARMMKIMSSGTMWIPGRIQRKSSENPQQNAPPFGKPSLASGIRNEKLSCGTRR